MVSKKLCFFYKIVKGVSRKHLMSYPQLHNNPIQSTKPGPQEQLSLITHF